MKKEFSIPRGVGDTERAVNLHIASCSLETGTIEVAEERPMFRVNNKSCPPESGKKDAKTKRGKG